MARFASGKRLARPLTHSRDSLITHGLSVKLSPCPCSHTIVARLGKELHCQHVGNLHVAIK